jgi:hypothetical protein
MGDRVGEKRNKPGRDASFPKVILIVIYEEKHEEYEHKKKEDKTIRIVGRKSSSK